MCFFPRPGIEYNHRQIPFKCGGCPECLSERSRLWALRCCAEAKNTPGVMVTLTYDTYIYNDKGEIIGENVSDKRVDKRDCQLFIKRLRKLADEPLLKAARAKANYWINQQYKHCKTKISKRNYRKYVNVKYGAEIQEFIRKYVEERRVKIKYLLTAEYGKRLHKTADGRLVRRPHYHAILFNAPIGECLPYKKSKRGNMIYKSPTLTKLWGNGICTVDSVSLSGKIARYCTKYCAKDSGSDDTFMLVSRGIGTDWLMENFNGISYHMDGREYPIPKLIWNKVILNRYEKRYANIHQFITTKYLSKKVKIIDEDGYIQQKTKEYGGIDYSSCWKAFEKSIEKVRAIGRRLQKEHYMKNRNSYYLAVYYEECRKRFQKCRDSDKQYQKYIEYWTNKAEVIEHSQKSEFERILALPNRKYFSYKQAALKCLNDNLTKKGNISWRNPPRANCIQYEQRLYYEKHIELESKCGCRLPLPWVKEHVICLPPSRHNKTNDTKVSLIPFETIENPFLKLENPVQLSLF